MLSLRHVLLLFSLNICVENIHGDKIHFEVNGTAIDNSDANENSECKINGTTPGTCQNIKNCPIAIQDLRNGTRPDICGFHGKEVMVCCVSSTELKELINETLGTEKLGSECLINATLKGTCQYKKNCAAAGQVLVAGSVPEICAFDANEEVICCVSNTESKESTNETLRTSKLNSECLINGTQPGTCQYIKNCPATVQALRVDTSPDTCGFDGNEAMVCCVSSRNLKKTRKETLGISKVMCKQYESQLCGRDLYSQPNVPKILIGGGRQSEPREFPHVAAIGYGRQPKVEWLCGGSLISDRYVLSAAHCTHLGSRFGTARWVRLGDLDLRSNDDDARPEDFEIIQHVNHPYYRPPVLYNDIALYKLDRVVSFNAYIKPICLHTFYQIPSYRGIANGWSRMGYAHPLSNVLMTVELPFVSPRTCSASTQRSRIQLPSGIDSKSMVCAGEEDGVKDTCQGDSGGPLSIHGKKCIHTQVGITSVRSLCGLPNSPGIYTRIAHFVPWIESIVWSFE